MKKTIALGAISAMALTGLAYSEIETDFHVGYNSEVQGIFGPLLV
ncbi:hypothetical protein [Roseibacillus ishigakijimensis]